MKDLFSTSIMICKSDKSYYISNVNYVEMNKEDYFKIINDNKFIFKKVNNLEVLNGQKLKVLKIVNLATDNLGLVDWLNDNQKDTLQDYMAKHPETEEEGYYLFNLEIIKEKTKEALKKISFSSKIEEQSLVANIYSNILNIQTTEYFEYLNRIILLTNNIHINENDLVDYMNDKINLNIEFRTITKRLGSKYTEEEGYVLKNPSTIFVLAMEKTDKDGNIIY